MIEKKTYNKKLKKRTKSFTAMIVVVAVLFAAGLALLLYPFFTSIPSYLQKDNQLTQWEAEKKNEVFLEQGNKLNDSEERFENRTEYDESANKKSAEESQSNAFVSDPEKDDKNYYKDDKTVTEETNVTADDLFPLKISIPKIEVEWITNEGADVPTLRKGPGHIPQTPLPGEEGRCTISGHRTTYGAPFNRINELEDGDLIYLETLNNIIFAYKVTDVEIVIPTYVEILIGSDKKELLLTTCYPEYSSRERMVVISELINIYPLDYNLG